MPWFDEKFNKHHGIKRQNEFILRRKKPSISISVTGKIIIANLIFFLLFYLASIFIDYNLLIDNIALKPSNILEGKKIWTLITHLFMHGGLGHLLVNMMSLLFIGNFIEKLIGKKRFIFVYFLGGITAAIFFIALSSYFGMHSIGEKIFGSPEIYAVGASGAIFALGGLLALLTPKMKVLIFFIIPMPLLTGMIFLLSLFWILSIIGGLPIGNSAHLGGLLFGILYGFYLKYKYPNKTRLIKKMFS